MFLTNFYPLSFTIFLVNIERGKLKHYDNYDMKEDRPMVDSAQMMNLLHEADRVVKTVTRTFSDQSSLMPARFRLKNVEVEDNITPGNLPAKNVYIISTRYKLSFSLC